MDSLSKVDGNMSGKSFRNTGIRNSIKGTIMNTINGTKRKTSAHVLKSWRDKRMSNIIHPGHAQAKQERPAEHSLLLRFSTAGKGKSLLQWSSEGTFMGYPRKADDNQYALVASLKGPHFDNTVLAKINFPFWEEGFYSAAQADLRILGSTDPPRSVFPVPMINSIFQCT